MNERIQSTASVKKVMRGGYSVYETVYEVLSDDMRSTEFTGSFDECIRYLQSQCPTGKCEN